MKKLLCTVIVALGMMFFAQSPALAYDAGTAGTAGVATAIGLETLYESSVIARMTGRAGAHTAKTAKGISFEVIFSDKQNLFHDIWRGSKTMLSPSSTDEVADLVKINKAGEAVWKYQLKDGDSPSQINLMLKQIAEGKYAGADDIVATTECAQLCNEKLVSKGMTPIVKDSGISTKTTTRIADKALGIRPAGAQVLNTTMKNCGVTAAIVSCLSLAESIYNDEDIYTATGELIVDTSVSVVSIALETVTAAELPAILASFGLGTVAANTTAAVIAIAVPVAVSAYALYVLDVCDAEEKIADGLEALVISLEPAFDTVETAINSVKDTGSEAWNSIQTFGHEACNAAEELANSSVAMVTSWITGAEAQMT